MDPTTGCCPKLACPARGQTGQGTMGIHAQKEQRCRCTVCRTTFTTTKGTAWSRVRTAADTVALVVTLMAHGCPLQAIGVACRIDGWVSSIRAMRETLRDPAPTGQSGRPRLRPWRHVLIAHVVKRSERRRVVETARRLVEGTPARVATRRRRSQGDGVIKTADIERRNATFRARLAALTRRGRALARHTLTLQHGMSLIGTVSHFCTPHASLAHAGGKPTPAMAAGITEHGWSVQELLSYHVPPPRWTPPIQRGRHSHALKRLIERWCGDHG